MTAGARDHGGGIDAAAARWGGTRSDWLDLSTGINPAPYPVRVTCEDLWTALPDRMATERLIAAARNFWKAPAPVTVLPAPGCSALIARIPYLAEPGNVRIDAPTYNEHRASFEVAGWTVTRTARARPSARVIVNPNNPTGTYFDRTDAPWGKHALIVIDESFCDVDPMGSLIEIAAVPGVIVLKSFGKFWGLAGLRLGFALGDPKMLARLAEMLGPWPVSGPALEIGARALEDPAWASDTRSRLRQDSMRLDALMARHSRGPAKGTYLFRLYDVGDAAAMQDRLARARIWSRIFPYSGCWLRLGLPGSATGWERLKRALQA
ncbi:MAG: threonine-phosphate decarboxylase [Pseudomonadota bacterium]